MEFSYLEIFGVIMVLLYLFLEVKQHWFMWVVGIISSLAYVFIFFYAKFYADMVFNGYYAIMSVYGLYVWKFSVKGEKKELPISHVTKSQSVIFIGVSLLCWAVIFFALKNLTDSPVPLGDAFTTALGVVATYMAARKIKEHWYFWIIVNFTSAFLYFYKDLGLTGALYIIYGVLSIYGYFRWQKSYLAQQKTA